MIVFTFHVFGAVESVIETNWAWLADIITWKLIPDVDPISVVVVSVKVTLPPFHTDIILPALAFDAEVMV